MRSRLKLPRSTICSLALLVCLVTPLEVLASGNVHVLLVGVSQYPNLDESMQLAGPTNDVSSYYQMLLERGISADRIHVVADGTQIPGAQLPTKKAILNGFEAIVQSLRSELETESFVFVLMSGHGSQMPAATTDRTETDGLDEIFLPRDVGRWDGEIGELPNAISDNEIGSAIARMRSTGAFVWAVFDNCHSGSIARSFNTSEEKSRSVPPAALGISPEILANAASGMHAARTRGGPDSESMIDASGSQPQEGGFVAFYASQSYELTYELPLPRFANDAERRGLFSYLLQQVLNTSSEASYRQVAEQVLQRYRAMGWSKSTPAIEGSALDATVFGAQVAAAPRQWPIEKKGNELQLGAGQLQEITQGSILAVVPEATSKDAQALGYVQVAEAGATQSHVIPVVYRDTPLLDFNDLPADGVFARPVELRVDFSLQVAEPTASAFCDIPSPRLNAAIEQLRQQPDSARRVRWVSAREPAEITLCGRKDRVLLLDASAQDIGEQALSIHLVTPDVDLPDDSVAADAIALGSALERIARATNLVKLAASGGASASSLVDFQLNYRRACTEDDAACSNQPQPLTPLSATVLRDGDKVSINISNTSYSSPVDISVLYVDATYGISVFYPLSSESARMEPRANTTIDLTINADPVGREKLMLIAIPAQPQSAEVRFDNLAQTGVTTATSRSMSDGPKHPLVALFEDATATDPGGAVRGALRPAQLASPQVSLYEWAVAQ